MGRFLSQKSSGKQPIKKRGIKRFLAKAANSHGPFRNFTWNECRRWRDNFVAFFFTREVSFCTANAARGLQEMLPKFSLNLSAKWPIFQPEFWGEFFGVNFGR